MRPEILNPLFTEVEALKGVGPQLAKLLRKLGVSRVVDLFYHLPTGAIERVRAPAASAALLGRNVILDLTPFEVRESRSGRGPMRVFASDSDGNTISLIYFNNPGWAKRSLPMGQPRTVSGKLEAYGDEWQIIHPEVSEPGKGPQPAIREPVYPLTEGLTNRRLGELVQNAPMLRLLQGDVGSGKTLVALFGMLLAVESGAQAALLAPTEILARQHYATLLAQLDSIGVRVAILTGREKGRARDSVLMGLADGSIDILVGTHAIFQEKVAYRKLGLAVIDEQHRFGVSQRLLLASKAEHPPHLLVMTATPIPRTLTLTQYGEMDVSRIDEMPPGRSPVETRVISEERLAEVVDGLGRHIAAGGQAYWVCPLVEESEKSDASAAEERARVLKLRFGDDKVGLVHGRMKGPDKDAVMARFAGGELAVLVATTVIEVGVDVPNATLMIVEGAERFGLAQLHQLRGRVGRGSGKSTCLLIRGATLTEVGRARLALMRETNDGFRIAEEDLRLRGPGEILGTRQSGDVAFRVATPELVQDLAPIATSDAQLLLERDGGLSGARGQAARICLYLFERDQAVGLIRSG